MAHSRDYKEFADLTGKLLSIPHKELAQKMEAEKRAKKQKKSKKSSASREAGDKA